MAVFWILGRKDINTIIKKLYASWDSRTFTQYVNRYNLPKDKPIKEYSSGMKTKLMLSAVFSRGTKLLILDERFTGEHRLGNQRKAAGWYANYDYTILL